MSDKKNPAIMAGKTGMVLFLNIHHTVLKGNYFISVHQTSTSTTLIKKAPD